jgi:pantetheine-phosphate adenylyltransferase
MSTPRTAIYPGSFDPVTNGHLDVLERALRLFDRVILAVAANERKNPLFTRDERQALVREAVATLPEGHRVVVTTFDGLLVDFAELHRASALIRGLRAVSDFEFEFQLALMNRKLRPNVETLFLMPSESCTYLSSNIIKEIARLGGAVGQFVPAGVEQALRKKFAA